MSIWTGIYRGALTALALLALILLAAVFYPPFRDSRELQYKKAALEEEIRLQEEKLKELKMKQDRLQNDPRFVEKIAREELGLAKPGEVVYRISDEPPAAGTARTSNAEGMNR